MNKVVAYCALLSVAFVLVACYDFEDPEFNELLADDLADLQNSLDLNPHPRSRRDDEVVNNDNCRGRRKRYCCADKLMEEIHEKDKEFKRACYREVTGRDKDEKPERGFDPFRCDKVEKHRKEITCVLKCVGQKRNLVDSEGNPKKEEFEAFVKENFAKESWLTSLQDKIISTCLNEGRNATASYESSDSESCNPATMKIAYCLFREIQLGCPEDQIKDQRSCSRIRDRIRKHQDTYIPPPPGFLNDE